MTISWGYNFFSKTLLVNFLKIHSQLHHDTEGLCCFLVRKPQVQEAPVPSAPPQAWKVEIGNQNTCEHQ